uniref:Uncharacterized protein n=1 Tax=uncultured Thiotrichaceae bacterium TaxID=298394 RepID=A0A6S6UCC3_9GAMM|nr:MAG: Unknown protein [uncultured Thiotrichaceae bacterium]
MMLDLAINFIIGLTLIGVPSYFFYRIGVDTGIKRGLRLQVLRGWEAGGAIDREEAKQPPPD